MEVWLPIIGFLFTAAGLEATFVWGYSRLTERVRGNDQLNRDAHIALGDTLEKGFEAVNTRLTEKVGTESKRIDQIETRLNQHVDAPYNGGRPFGRS
jgi:hypothetical protein